MFTASPFSWQNSNIAANSRGQSRCSSFLAPFRTFSAKRHRLGDGLFGDAVSVQCDIPHIKQQLTCRGILPKSSTCGNKHAVKQKGRGHIDDRELWSLGCYSVPRNSVLSPKLRKVLLNGLSFSIPHGCLEFVTICCIEQAFHFRSPTSVASSLASCFSTSKKERTWRFQWHCAWNTSRGPRSKRLAAASPSCWILWIEAGREGCIFFGCGHFPIDLHDVFARWEGQFVSATFATECLHKGRFTEQVQSESSTWVYRAKSNGKIKRGSSLLRPQNTFVGVNGQLFLNRPFASCVRLQNQ